MSNRYSESGTKYKSQLNNETNNPCYKEHTLSLKCMSDNNYDQQSCQLQFQNYRTCKEFWNEVQRLRRIKGIRPLLPPLDERNEIKAKFKETGKIVV